MRSFLLDLRYAVRTLVKNPGFAAVAVSTLALGIGANTAIFSLIHGLLLKELPVRQPGQLVNLSVARPARQAPGFSYPAFEELRRQPQLFSGLFAWWGDAIRTFEARGNTWQGSVTAATGEFYQVLGVSAVVGRTFTPADERDAVAVLGFNCWKNRFGGDPTALGEIIRINGKPFTIIGVTGREFYGLTRGISQEAVVPYEAFARPDRLSDRKYSGLDIMGRLKDGVTIDQARTRLAALWPQIQSATAPADSNALASTEGPAPPIEIASAAMGSLNMRNVHRRFARPLAILMGAVALVLLIACVNLATLFLSRNASRQRELSVRTALGAGPGRLLRQLLTECLLVAFVGALLGLWVSRISAQLMTVFMSIGMLRQLEVSIAPDARILAFTAVITAATVALFGMGSAWRAVHQDPANALQRHSRSVAGGARLSGRVLVVAQVSLTFILMAAAGLFSRSLSALRSVDLGFGRDGVIEMWLTDKPGGYENFNRGAYYRELVDRIAQVPGVRSVALANNSPSMPGDWRVSVSARSGGAALQAIEAQQNVVSPLFFQTLGIPFRQGRDFEARDDEQAPRVAILNAALARRLFPQGDPIGRRVTVGDKPEHRDVEVIGVVNDATLWGIRDSKPPGIFLSYFQETHKWPILQVRTTADPSSILPVLRTEVESLRREFPLRARMLARGIDDTLVQERLLAALSTLFGVAGVLLTCMGLYGLLSFTISRRTNEIGIRIALGAQRSEVLRMVLRDAMAPVAVGVLIGIPCTLAIALLIRGLLFGIGPADPVTFLLVSFLLIVVALVASYLPARRATRVDPMVALRYE